MGGDDDDDDDDDDDAFCFLGTISQNCCFQFSRIHFNGGLIVSIRA